MNSHDIDQLECDTVTKLAEILLHPPTSVLGDDYCWDNDADADDATAGKGGGVRRSGSSSNMDISSRGNNAKGKMKMFGEGKMEEGEAETAFQICGECNNDNMQTTEHYDPTSLPTALTKLPPIHNNTASSLPTTRYATIAATKSHLSTAYTTIPRRVCQYPFKRNDIVWVCRTCQSDETCVLCHECFSNSNHEGHDVAFYHAQAGGCCDCGDEDAWDPNGFCNRHGGPCKQGSDKSNVSGIGAESSVLGGVHAIADYLVKVVQSSVEGGYVRANPLLFQNATVNAEGAVGGGGGGDGTKRGSLLTTGARSDSVLPEYYEESDGGRTRRHQRRVRRSLSLERRNTVADVEITTAATGDNVLHSMRPQPSSPIASPPESFRMEEEESEEEGSDTQGLNAMDTSIALSDNDSNNDDTDEIAAAVIMPSNVVAAASAPPTPSALHEMQFDPAMASSSKGKFSKRDSAMSFDYTNDNDDEEGGDEQKKKHNAFDPAAASKSKSSSSKIPMANADDDDDDDDIDYLGREKKIPRTDSASSMLGDLVVAEKKKKPSKEEVKTPARALGDLALKEHGLFLILHCDDVHMVGNHSAARSSESNREVMNALKELYSTPGGGGGGSNVAEGTTGGGSNSMGGGGVGLGPIATGINHFPGRTTITTNTFGTNITTTHRGLTVGGNRPSSLFRAPHAEAILDKIVKLVKKQGDLIVWGTQEILAECGKFDLCSINFSGLKCARPASAFHQISF